MNSSTIIILAILGLAAAIFITWIIRKLVFEKNHIPLAQFNELNERFQQTVTANARSFATAVMLKDKSPDVPCGEFRLSANDEEIKLTCTIIANDTIAIICFNFPDGIFILLLLNYLYKYSRY